MKHGTCSDCKWGENNTVYTDFVTCHYSCESTENTSDYWCSHWEGPALSGKCKGGSYIVEEIICVPTEMLDYYRYVRLINKVPEIGQAIWE